MVTLGYDHPLYILAFDHRGSLQKGLLELAGDPTPEEAARISDVKAVIYDGFHAAIAAGVTPGEAAILVDEQFGAPIARAAAARNELFAMTVEKSGGDELAFEYGNDFGAHLETFNPSFAKVLVRYNPDGDAALNARQAALLKLLAEWLHDHGRKLLLEVVIPPTSTQLAAVGGDTHRYDAEVRPRLTLRTITALHDAGVETDVWKIEGLDRRDDCERVGTLIRSGERRQQVGCVVLGRGASAARVDHWLRQAAGVPGYLGFAIGRTLWWDSIKGYLAGSLDRAAAVEQIGAAYRRAIDVYTAAANGLTLDGEKRESA
jgi:myo-inositol catabolism protein IolC